MKIAFLTKNCPDFVKVVNVKLLVAIIWLNPVMLSPTCQLKWGKSVLNILCNTTVHISPGQQIRN